MVALTSFEVLWIYPLWFPCFGKCSLCIIVASLLVKRCAWSVVVRGFELNTCTIYQIWCTRKKSMSLPIIISNWQCWKLFCPCIVIVIYWACALCVPAIIYTQGLGLPGEKKNIYMNLKGLIPVRFFCKAVTDNGNSLLWIFMIECYGNRCSWEPCSNYTGVAVLLIDKQCDNSLKLCVKVDSRWRCHFLSYYNYVPLYILFHLEIQCIQLSIFTLFQACSMCIINDSNSLKTFFCCQDKWSRWDIHELKGTSNCSQQQTKVFVMTLK